MLATATLIRAMNRNLRAAKWYWSQIWMFRSKLYKSQSSSVEGMYLFSTTPMHPIARNTRLCWWRTTRLQLRLKGRHVSRFAKFLGHAGLRKLSCWPRMGEAITLPVPVHIFYAMSWLFGSNHRQSKVEFPFSRFNWYIHNLASSKLGLWYSN